MSDHPFRSPESYAAEKITRDLLPLFLQSRGFVVEGDARKGHGQTIVAKNPAGERWSMRVRLCWRRDENSRYSAAQLLSKIKDDDWTGTLQAKVNRERAKGVTHFLIAQRDGSEITNAALIPLAELIPVWIAQRDTSTRLIDEGKLGRRKKNHAMNGASPTIWLEDETGGQEVADALWNHPGVQNISDMPLAESRTFLPEEIQEPSLLCIEGATRRVLVNAYERDPASRRRCIAKHGTSCCVCGFNFAAAYGAIVEGYIHVHHIRPLSEVREMHVVDPEVDLMPVCPNCHAVLHSRVPAFTLEEVRQFLNQRPDGLSHTP